MDNCPICEKDLATHERVDLVACLRGSVKAPLLEVHNLEDQYTVCPAQWTARTHDGKDVYIRYRHGYLSVHVYNEQVFGLNHTYDNGVDGMMSTEDMLRFTNIREIK